MNAELIPAILEKDFAAIAEKISQVEAHARWVQIDVVDGIFAPNITWNNPPELRALHTGLKIEVDLMIADPQRHMAAWIQSGAARIFFHAEAATDAASIIEEVHSAGLEVGMSLNPSTAPDILEEYIPKLDAVLFLGVEPGFQGQPFHEEIIGRVAGLRKRYPTLPIEVDGGIKQGIARRLVQAGATRIITGSAVFGGGPEEIMQRIKILETDITI